MSWMRILSPVATVAEDSVAPSKADVTFVSSVTGKVWSLPFSDVNTAGDDDYVFYLTTTGDNAIEITDIRLSSTAATRVYVHSVEGTVSGGTSINPISRTIGSSATMDGMAEYGTDLTGLTSAGIAFFLECPVANTLYHLKTSSGIRVPRGQAIALLVENGTADLTGVVSVVQHSISNGAF